MQKLLLSHLFCLMQFFGIAQDIKITQDSLRKIDEEANIALESYDYTTTIDQSALLIELASKENNVKYLYRGYRNLGVTYQTLNDLKRAELNYEKALNFALQTDNDTLLMGAYNNLGNVFSEDEKTINKGVQYYKKAIEHGTNISDYSTLLVPYMNIGWTYLDNGGYDKAFPYLNKALHLLENDQKGTAYSQIMALLGKYYAGMGEFAKSQQFFKSSLNIANRDSLLTAASFAYREYGKMLYKFGKYQQAYEMNNVFQEYQAKIFKEEKLHQMEAAYAKLGMEQREKELELALKEQEYQEKVLMRTKMISIILVILIIVLLVLLLLFVRSNRLRKTLLEKMRQKNKELFFAKERAEKLTSLKTRFFSTVSHELRTPLYGVVGLTTFLLEDNPQKKQVDDLKSLKFSADYLLALINDVLEMNKMESGLVQLEKFPFNLRDLIDNIMKSFEFVKRENDNTIKVEIASEVPEVLIGDSVRLSQVLMNLIGNALKFTERGEVWLKIETKKSSGDMVNIYFEVGDTGIGIPESKQELIFEEFSQLNLQNLNYQGTGLGLSIVRRLLHLFNSKIEVNSIEGKGSIFNFGIMFQLGSQEENREPHIPHRLDSSSKTVLIVDDNKINRIVTKRVLEKQQIVCSEAGGGYEAIDILRKENYDLVLMDVNMPEIDGLETTKKIRSFNADIPIIALTAVELDEIVEKIINAGMQDIIVKPYDQNLFYNTIYKYLLNKKAS